MKVTHTVVRQCYNLLLDREPSAAEVDFFYGHSEKEGWESKQLVAAMIDSVEFKKNIGSSKQEFFDNLGEVEYRNLSFILPKEDFSTNALRDPRGYEPYVSNHLFAQLAIGETFLDVGANLGLFALPAARAVGAKGTVIAFEALPENVRLLSRNAVRNAIKNIIINPIALGDFNGSTTTLRVPTSDRILLAPGTGLSEEVDVIPVVRLDDFMHAKTKIDVMKIDVEGYEYRVFCGASRLVCESRPRIYMEYNSRFQMEASLVPGSALIKMLHDYGYRFTILHRDSEPELVKGTTAEDVAAFIDAAVCRMEAVGVSHLDLYLAPP